MARLGIISVVLFFVAAFDPLCGSDNPPNSKPSDQPVQIAMRNLEYHYTPEISVGIRFLHGQLLPTDPSRIVFFDRKESFVLVMAYSQIALSFNALADLLNQQVFAADDAPIKELRIQSRGNVLFIRGKLHRKASVPFETTGTISATPEGRIRLHAEKVSAVHVPVKGLMDLLGLDFAALINTNKVRGITAEKDDLILDPEEILPMPRIKGKVTAVQIEGNQLVQTFGTKQDVDFDPVISGNYMAFRGGEFRFGKLTMHDTDMVLIDMDPRDPFDFFLDFYKEQLMAGYSKTTSAWGLRVHMRDYNKLKPKPENASQEKQ